MRRRVAVLFIALTWAAPAAASPATDRAKQLMIGGQLDAARVELEAERAAHPGDVETLFLLGMLAMEQKRPREAVGHFREALVHEPGAVRIRLELARAFFETGDLGNAQRQFERARAGNPPPAVIATIDRFAARIRQDREWSYHVGVAVAPDSNINGATSAREAVLFGIPFELNDDARAKSGVGALVEGRVTFAPALGDGWRLRTNLAGERRDYRGGDFDDTVASLEVGPTFAKGKWQAGLAATGFVRRLGPDRRMRGPGARFDLTYFPDSRTALPGSLVVQRVRFNDIPAYDSTILGASVGVARALSPATIASARIEGNRRNARADFASSRSVALALMGSHDFTGGFTLRAEPRIEWTRFDADDPYALAPRNDRLREVAVSVLNRRLRVGGFTPRIGLRLTRRASSVDLYRYHQRRLEIGVTSDF